MKKIAIVALAAAATFITSCDIERLPYDKYTEDKIMEDKDAVGGCFAKRLLRKTEKGIRTLALLW